MKKNSLILILALTISGLLVYSYHLKKKIESDASSDIKHLTCKNSVAKQPKDEFTYLWCIAQQQFKQFNPSKQKQKNKSAYINGWFSVINNQILGFTSSNNIYNQLNAMQKIQWMNGKRNAENIFDALFQRQLYHYMIFEFVDPLNKDTFLPMKAQIKKRYAMLDSQSAGNTQFVQYTIGYLSGRLHAIITPHKLDSLASPKTSMTILKQQSIKEATSFITNNTLENYTAGIKDGLYDGLNALQHTLRNEINKPKNTSFKIQKITKP